MNQTLVALYAVQEADSALASAYKKYRALDQGQVEQAAAASAKAAAERVSGEFHETTRDLHDAELELKSVEAKRKDYESRLYGGKVTAYKEIEGMQHEVEALGRQRARLDERILELMDLVETRRAADAETAAHLKAADEAVARKQAQFKTVGRQLALEMQTLKAQREALAQPIPAPLMKRYETIRAAKSGVGIGYVNAGQCSVCHQQLSAYLMTAVEDTDAVLLCENCGRLLCFKPK